MIWSLVGLLVLLSHTAGTSHWRLQDDGVIKAVPGVTVISRLPTDTIVTQDNYEDATFVYDKEFFILVKELVDKKQGWSYQQQVTDDNIVSTSSTPHQQPSQEKPVKLRISKSLHNPGNGATKCQKVQYSSETMATLCFGESTEEGTQILTIPHNTGLTCGEPPEFTAYDFLKGVALREEHPGYPEPDVAMIFRKSKHDLSVDIADVENRLIKAMQENPLSPHIHNQVGNLFRIRGDTLRAIDCFRQALALDPANYDVILNLARVLLNLKFYDDAIFLAKRSLHLKGKDAWLQHYTIGEAYKSAGRSDDAIFYFKKALEINPELHGAEAHIRELKRDNEYTNIYTVIIILSLITAVLLVIYFWPCGSCFSEDQTATIKKMR